MMDELRAEVGNLCLKYAHNGVLWGFTVDELANYLVSDADVWLWENEGDSYADAMIDILHNLFSADYCNKKITHDEYEKYCKESCGIFQDEFEKICAKSSLAKRVIVKTDLRDKTEMTLSNGEVIEMNPHLKEQKNG